MGGAEFTVLAVLLRFVYRRRELGDNFGLGPVMIDWPGVKLTAVGVDWRLTAADARNQPRTDLLFPPSSPGGRAGSADGGRPQPTLCSGSAVCLAPARLGRAGPFTRPA
jgi:hypothetical protein